MKRKLILEDGTSFIGEGIGANKDSVGEVVFHTAMTGYQEIISDPTNFGQILVFSYPLIGNYGINRDDFESIQPTVKGVIMKEVCDFPSNWRSHMSMAEFLKLKQIPGIAGIDTRMVTKKLRDKGPMKGIICSIDENDNEILLRLKATRLPMDEIKHVSCVKPYSIPGRGTKIVVIDFGVKHGILRELTKRGCDVKVVPYDTSVADILSLRPDGVILSNGPGNPENIKDVLPMIKEIQKTIPILGIGLGHQLFAMANGCHVKKMTFGHRGASYPVKNMKTGKVFFTSQNHGYEVVKDSINEKVLDISYQALNGESVEGLLHKTFPSMSIQFQPEASPGAEDGKIIFDEFLQLIAQYQERMEQNA